MTRQRLLLYLICGLTDFAAFVVVFVASRSLAEARVEPTTLGLIGGGLAFSQGIGAMLGGWLSHRFDARTVFLSGAAMTVVSVMACASTPASLALFLPGYWMLGIALGFLYPPLIGWLNEGTDAHRDRAGVSRTLFIFCVAWNVGMMGGVLTAGSLFAKGRVWAMGASLAASLINLALAGFVAWRHRPAPVREVEPETPISLENVALANAFRRLSWLANLGGMFGGSMVIHLLPDLMVLIRIPAEEHGKLIALWRMVVVGTYFAMHSLSFWHYRLSTALASQLLAAGGLVVISQAQSSTTLMIGLAMLGQLVGYNYFAGLFYSTAGATQSKRALAAGIHEATLAGGMAVGTVFGGLLGSTVSHRMPYLLAAAVTAVLAAMQIASHRVWAPRRTLVESAEAK